MCYYKFAFLLLGSFLLSFSSWAQPVDGETFTSEEVAYSNRDISLAATLLIPTGPGPFPGVVIVHGSGSSDRSNPWTSAYATSLVERGIAVLHPDKRGSGASGGNWRDATFLDLAHDAIAALDVLSAHPLVDTARVGVIGFSQGGHVVPVVATRSPAVSFVINVSGSVVPILEQIGDEIRQMGEQEGLTADELATVQSIHKRAVAYVLTGEGWDAYAEALAEATRGHLANAEVVAGFPTEPDSPAWNFLRTIGNFDPLPYWRKVKVPALFLYGGRDENVDVYKSADVIEKVLTPTGLAYSLLLFRNNGHGLYRDDAMEFIAQWIRDGGID
ncbi:MAG TPA: alpha/beta fold hydrolase [Rhodothermales bacterium]|nr:alpha/beta fold hydrolase [Rhodothermales bacterium]